VNALTKKEFQFLPMDLNEAKLKGWYHLDIILITGDAYIDHPTFGVAIIGRILEKNGFKVGIIAQPQDEDDFFKLGRPRLFFGITAGNMDSMVSNYTPLLKKREKDVYSPGGRPGLRPDRATIVYTSKIKEYFKKIPIIIGGIEASLRRFAHYDYWSNKIRRSILFDSKADLLIYGMGEKPIIEIAKRIKNKSLIRDINDIRGTCTKLKKLPENTYTIPSYTEVKNDKDKFITAFLKIYENSNPFTAIHIAQSQNGLYLYQNPPIFPLTTEELDEIYELPYQYRPHPSYKQEIPAFNTIKTSITTHRGCFGGCNFCSLHIHQGKIIQDRSIESIIQEINKISKLPFFKGSISDLGGPSAEMYGIDCKIKRYCTDKNCISPEICKHLEVDFSKFRKLLSTIRKLPSIKNAFIQSGFRFDLLLEDVEFLEEIMKYHISGQMKVAPEHIKDKITVNAMNKAKFEKFKQFLVLFKKISNKINKKIYIIPYWLASHPNTTLNDQIDLAIYLKQNNLSVKQTQIFIPTPLIPSTCMYYTGKSLNQNKIYIPYSFREKKMQKALMHFNDPRQHNKIRAALKICGRDNLIGNTPNSLIYPKKIKKRD